METGNEHEQDETPGQKRKRPAAEPPNERNTQTQQERDPQTTSEPTPPPQENMLNLTPLPPRDLPLYEMPQFNRPGTQSPQTSPTREAQKRRKLLSSGQTAHETNQEQEQGMEINKDLAQEAGPGSTPTTNNRRWYEDTPGKRNATAQQEGEDSREKETVMTVKVDELANA